MVIRTWATTFALVSTLLACSRPSYFFSHAFTSISLRRTPGPALLAAKHPLTSLEKLANAETEKAETRSNGKQPALVSHATASEPMQNTKREGEITPKEQKQKATDNREPRPTLPLGTLLGRTLDTVEDAIVHLRRLPNEWGWFGDDAEEKTQTVVVLGSGWAAHALLKVADTFKLRVIVVSPLNHFTFTPMLASAAVGTVEYRSMTEAVRAANPMIEDYIEGRAVDVDLENQVVKVQLQNFLDGVREGKPPTIDIKYDTLVVAVGCKVADSMIPGAAQHALKFKTCNDARRLRTAIGECLEYASRPDVEELRALPEDELARRQIERRNRATFAIVGGGPAGVELAGELSDFVRDVTRPRGGSYPRLKDDVRIVLVEYGPELVPPFDPVLRAHAKSSLEKAGVDVRVSTKVMEIGDGFIKLAKTNDVDSVETMEAGICILAAGTEPVEFVKLLLGKLPEEARGRGGRIAVDQWLRCPVPSSAKLGSVMVLGDAALFNNENHKSFLPQTAQVAAQQGAYVARMLCREYDVSVTPPKLSEGERDLKHAWLALRGLETAHGFEFLNMGILAYVGSGDALSQIQIGDFPVLSYAGSISYMLWRSVYLVKQVATRNRVLVTMDWLKSAVFGRDVTRL